MKKSHLIVGLLISAFVIVGATIAQAADKVDMTGTWNCAVTTPQGTGTPIFELKQAGDKLTGTYQGQFGKTAVTGSVKGTAFEINFVLDPDKVKVIYKGKIEGGKKISGTIEFVGKAKGTFVGEKG